MKLASIVALNRGAWAHPWRSTGRWNAREKRWEVTVKPGLVNGLDPTVELDGAEIPLADRPALPVPGYHVPDPVPDYFLVRGVQAPPKLDTFQELLISQIEGVLGDTAAARQLRACDVVLEVDKPTMQTEWTTGAGVDGTVAQFSVGIAYTPGYRKRARMRLVAQHIPLEPAAVRDLLTGFTATEPRDVLHLATVHFLSPRGASPDAVPDETWRSITAHHVFWPLHHGMKQLEPPLKKQNLTLNTGLAGGAGDAINNFILSQVNDQNSAAAEFLGRQQLETRFWTV